MIFFPYFFNDAHHMNFLFFIAHIFHFLLWYCLLKRIIISTFTHVHANTHTHTQSYPLPSHINHHKITSQITKLHLIYDRNEQNRREETLLWQIQDLSSTLIRVQNELNIASNTGRLIYDETEQIRLENVLIDHQINRNISINNYNNGKNCVNEDGRNRNGDGMVEGNRENVGEGDREAEGGGEEEGKGEREEEGEGEGEEEVSSVLCTAPSPPSLLLDCHYLAPPLSLLSHPHHTNQQHNQHPNNNQNQIEYNNHTLTPPLNQKENIEKPHISSHNINVTSTPTTTKIGEKISVSCQVEITDFPVTEIITNTDSEIENLRIIEQNSNLSETVKYLETELQSLNEEKTKILDDNKERINKINDNKLLFESTLTENEKVFNIEMEKLTIELNENKIEIENMKNEIILLTNQK